MDVGGGCGHFALAVRNEFFVNIRVIDSDPGSIKSCEDAGINASLEDELKPHV